MLTHSNRLWCTVCSSGAETVMTWVDWLGIGIASLPSISFMVLIALEKILGRELI